MNPLHLTHAIRDLNTDLQAKATAFLDKMDTMIELLSCVLSVLDDIKESVPNRDTE